MDEKLAEFTIYTENIQRKEKVYITNEKKRKERKSLNIL